MKSKVDYNSGIYMKVCIIKTFLFSVFISQIGITANVEAQAGFANTFKKPAAATLGGGASGTTAGVNDDLHDAGTVPTTWGCHSPGVYWDRQNGVWKPNYGKFDGPRGHVGYCPAKAACPHKGEVCRKLEAFVPGFTYCGCAEQVTVSQQTCVGNPAMTNGCVIPSANIQPALQDAINNVNAVRKDFFNQPLVNQTLMGLKSLDAVASELYQAQSDVDQGYYPDALVRKLIDQNTINKLFTSQTGTAVENTDPIAD